MWEKLDEEINDGHYLELMDRLHIVTHTINDFILMHPLTESNSELYNKVHTALDLLLDSYQMVGKKLIENKK